jgi:CheY-like chemotaxis protein
MRQILTNLLLNAIAMSPRGSTVQIDAGANGAEAFIFVADEGPGVPPERRATLFVDGLSTRAGGAGIGLRHSAALARAAGGVLRLVPSERGARFEVRWPLTADVALERHSPIETAHDGAVETGPPSSVAPTRRAPRVSLDGVRILLVEDDEAVIELLDTALTARGAIIISVRAPVDLPGALAGGTFHAALLDISPIEQDVLGTVSAVRGANPGIRLVVMTGSAVIVPELEGDFGASWVRKPFEVREIVDALVR